jgi:hypothetical protein
VSEAIYPRDPDGLGIEVYADRPREQWQYIDRQLVMTTEPLDVDEAAAFYHRGLDFDTTVGATLARCSSRGWLCRGLCSAPEGFLILHRTSDCVRIFR